MSRKKEFRAHRVQAVHGAGWFRHQYGVEIDGKLWLNSLGHAHPFKTDRAAVEAARRHLCARCVEVLPTKKIKPVWLSKKVSA